MALTCLDLGTSVAVFISGLETSVPAQHIGRVMDREVQRARGGRAQGMGAGGGGRAGAAWAGPTCSAKVEAGEKASTICPSYLAFRCLDSCLCRTHTGGSSVDTGGESSSGVIWRGGHA